MATLDHTAPPHEAEAHETPAPSAYTTLNQALLRVYTLNWELIAYTVIAFVAVLTRFWDLGARVMSHDESLHTYYSYLLYDRGDFDHTPLMHGPLLFHMTALSYFLFGVNDFSGRIYTALLGVLIVVMPFLFRRWLGKMGALLVSAGFLISPMLLYYSRYIRHDIPTIFFALVLLYAVLQYVDGETPRRPVWIGVMGVSLSLMMASKEVAFIYIAIFGSFLTLYWLVRMLQGFTFAPDSDQKTEAQRTTGRWLHRVVGHGLTVLAAGASGYLVGGLIWQFWITTRNPTPVPRVLLQLGAAVVMFAMLQGVAGLVSRADGGAWRSLGAQFAGGLRQPRSALMLIIVGTVLGGVLALISFTVLDIIKPDDIWQEIRYTERISEQANAFDDPTEQQAYLQRYMPGSGQKIEAITYDFNSNNFFQVLTWILTPTLLLIFATMVIAILKSPGGRLPVRDVLVIFLIAFIIGGIFLAAEQRSVESHERHRIEEQRQQEFDRDQQQLRELLGEGQATVSQPSQPVNNLWIILTWVVGGILTTLVLASRLMTGLWDYFNRQPIFDVLIAIGTMVLPWTAAVPLFMAGYNLDQVPLGPNTVEAAIAVSIPFFLVSAAVGLAWNWRVWPVMAVAFWLPFAVFFTTFFTNGNGLGTGVIGSLGYWLEQQGVRRGSQPQYYYTLVQMPVYEYLPLILASLAGFFGLSQLFAFRSRSRQEAAQAADEAAAPEAEDSAPPQTDGADGGHAAHTATFDRTEVMAMQQAVDTVDDRPRWQQPYHKGIETGMRQTRLEYLGGLPFFLLLGYWAVVMFVGLTMAGEKMPWLTTHLTVPLIMIGGWYAGHVIERIDWSALRRGGWLLMVLVIPILGVALVQVILPFLTGESLPFQGDTQAGLESTGQWIAALLAVLATGYVVARISLHIGLGQARRIIFAGVALVLALVTLRTAWMASFINYDYATEFLVYAHAGPAVKTVMDDLGDISDRHPQGNSLKVVYDDKSTWPLVWYLRDYDNLTYITLDGLRQNPSQLDGAVAVIVGEDKNGEVQRLLGDNYYRFDYIRLWWPMQEYFNLNYERVERLFSPNNEFPAASLFRRGIWDIWWARDYERYGQAMCLESNANQCLADGADADNPVYDANCIANQRRQCVESNNRFDVADWPVRDRLFFYVDKNFVAQIWDVGLDGRSVDERIVPDPENAVYQAVEAEMAFGTGSVNAPRGVAVDDAGNVYVADSRNHRIAVFDPAGNLVSTLGEGQLNEPWSVAVSPTSGNIVVADTWSHRVVIFSPEGELLNTFGQYGQPGDPTYTDPMTMYGPRNVTVDRLGYIYVADTGGHRIRVYDDNLNHVRDLGGEGSGFGQMLEPVGVAVNPVDGNIYVAETWNQRISVYNRDGSVVRTWPVNMWAGTDTNNQRPYLAFSPDGSLLLVSDMDNSASNNGPRVVAYDLSGQAVLSFNAPEGSPSFVNTVAGLALGPNGRLVVADAGSSRLVVFPPLTVQGSVAPAPNPDYAPPPTDVDTSQTEPQGTGPQIDSATSPAEQEVAQVGLVYWQALTSADYVTFTGLYCRAVQPLLPDEAGYIRNVAGPYTGANLSGLTIAAEVEDEAAVVRWEGSVILNPGTGQAFEMAAATIAPLQLVREDGNWKICDRGIFRPGGA